MHFDSEQQGRPKRSTMTAARAITASPPSSLRPCCAPTIANNSLQQIFSGEEEWTSILSNEGVSSDVLSDTIVVALESRPLRPPQGFTTGETPAAQAQIWCIIGAGLSVWQPRACRAPAWPWLTTSVVGATEAHRRAEPPQSVISEPHQRCTANMEKRRRRWPSTFAVESRPRRTFHSQQMVGSIRLGQLRPDCSFTPLRLACQFGSCWPAELLHGLRS